MKKRKITQLMITVMILMMLTACGGGNNAEPTPEPSKAPDEITGTGDVTTPAPTEAVAAEYFFEYEGTKIQVGQEAAPVMSALGKENFFFEAESCAFEGKDRIYTYNGFELYTYNSGDTEYIFSILFIDDSRKTPEGIGLGSSFADVTAAYGENYEKNFEQYSYINGATRLSFLFEEDEVVSVEYYLVQ